MELSVAYDPDIVSTALAPVFFEALERSASTRLDALETSLPGVLRLTLIDDASAQALAEQRGFEVAHAEDDMACTRPAPASLDGLDGTFVAWTPEHARTFFEAYEGSFRDRPGFPGWSEEAWHAFSSGYDAFRPDLSHVLVRGGAPVGFRMVAVEDAEAYIVQMGVVPAARRTGVGRALITDLAARLPDCIQAVTLSVNANNPGARALFEQAGFAVERRRTVMRKVLSS